MQLDDELFSVGGTVVSLETIVILVSGILGVYVLARWIVRPLVGRILHHSTLAPSSQYSLSKLVQYLLLTFGVLVTISASGFSVTNFAFAIGFLSVGIGFGLQNITSNFVAGLILIFEHPVRVGDWVTVSGIEGSVEEINIRSTKIRSPDNIFVYVPNSDFISGNVLNWTNPDPLVRVAIELEVAQDTDLGGLETLLKTVSDEHPSVLKEPAAEMRLVGIGDSSWKLQLLVWLMEPRGHRRIESELFRSVVSHFEAAGIATGTPIRVIKLSGPASAQIPS